MKQCLIVFILASLLAGGVYAVHGSATVLDSFSTADWSIYPTGLTYDGSNLWLTDSFNNHVFKVTTMGSVLSSFDFSPITPGGISWDGSAFWIIGIPSGSIHNFYHVSTTGSILSTISGVLNYSVPYGVQYLSGSCWVTSNYYERMIYLHTMGNGSILSSMQTIVKYPCGICYDGTNLLVSGNDDGRTHRYSTTGTYLDYFNPPFETNAYTGESVWVNGNMYWVNTNSQMVYHISVDWNPNMVEPSSLGVVRSLFR